MVACNLHLTMLVDHNDQSLYSVVDYPCVHNCPGSHQIHCLRNHWIHCLCIRSHLDSDMENRLDYDDKKNCTSSCMKNHFVVEAWNHNRHAYSLKNGHIWAAWNMMKMVTFFPLDIPGLAVLFPLLTAQCTVA